MVIIRKKSVFWKAGENSTLTEELEGALIGLGALFGKYDVWIPGCENF